MKQLFFFLLIFVSGFWAACGGDEAGVKTISPAEFKTMQTEPNTVVMDVRTPGEIAEGVIPGASLYLDYNAADFDARLDGLDKEKTYLVYCRSGNRSGKAAAMMQKKGFKKLYNLDGGTSGWPEPLAGQ